jgi:flagellar biosynthesis/type III secretory pathway M-ring protein FliF/YscJ
MILFKIPYLFYFIVFVIALIAVLWLIRSEKRRAESQARWQGESGQQRLQRIRFLETRMDETRARIARLEKERPTPGRGRASINEEMTDEQRSIEAYSKEHEQLVQEWLTYTPEGKQCARKINAKLIVKELEHGLKREQDESRS